jgi:CheY-like chemotaxis protein
VRGALEVEADLEAVAEVGRGDAVVGAALEYRPDVALLDIEMPDGDGNEAARALGTALPGCLAVILTTFGRPGFLRRAVEVGAAGFLVKDAPVAELARGIRAVMAGERVIDRDLAAAAPAIGATPLSAREADVLRVAAAARGWPTSPDGWSCRRGRCASTCPRRSGRPAPAPGWTRQGSPRTRAGSDAASGERSRDLGVVRRGRWVNRARAWRPRRASAGSRCSCSRPPRRSPASWPRRTGRPACRGTAGTPA